MSEKSIIALKKLQGIDEESDIRKRSLINNIKKNSHLSLCDGFSLLENGGENINQSDSITNNRENDHKVELFKNREESGSLSHLNNESVSHTDGTENYKRLDSSLSGKDNRIIILRILSIYYRL